MTLLPKPKDIAILRNKAFVKLYPSTETSEEKPQSHLVFLFIVIVASIPLESEYIYPSSFAREEGYLSLYHRLLLHI